MAPPAGTLRVGRYFLALLAIVAVLYAIVFWPGQRHAPKLGLDLEGGTQIVFTAKTPNGGTPKKSAMEQAKQIITKRVNGTGVTEATVVIQGSNQLVVSIPGDTHADPTQLGKAAVLNFRGVVMPAAPIACTSSSSAAPSGSPSPGASSATAPSNAPAAPKDARQQPLAAASGSPSAAASGSPSAAASGSPSAAASGSPAAGSAAASPSASSSASAPPPCTATPFKGLGFTVPPNDVAFETLTPAQQTQLRTALSRFDCNAGEDEKDDPNAYFIACDDGSQFGFPVAYLLGPVIVAGQQISSAGAQAPSLSGTGGTAEWSVTLSLKSSGQSAWAKYTGAHNISSLGAVTPDITSCSTTTVPCADFVAFTLDGQVISAPYNNQAINGGKTMITGNFTQTSADNLANQLKYGALPLSFTNQDAQTVSATLGTSQLEAGLLAGGIGLALVVLYSLLYYRALGLVTIASLVVSAVLTYGSLVMLATQIDFTLSLSGIAGFIVAIGITADSFVVFFERLKDEVHEGRSIRVAVPRAWVRARRTILSADTVSFLAAAILYYFAAGDVKGFAFTLGLSTILDLVVVFLFTHPLVSLLSRSRAFGSARFTGLNAVREGGIAAVDIDDRAPVRTRQPARAERAAATEQPASERFAGVAVLDRGQSAAPGGPPPGSAGEPAAPPADAVPAGGAGAAEPASEPGETDTPDESRRTTPKPGTAAERAAARRARLREQGQPKGKR